jgi:Arylsulfotransferase (ASST)
MPLSHRLPRIHQIMGGLSILGLMLLSFVVGTAIMYFQVPPADFFRKAFKGGLAWQDQERARNEPSSTLPAPLKDPRATIDQPNKTFDGFSLYTTTENSCATLIDMRGNVVHRWSMPFSKAWPRPAHIRRPFPDDKIHWFRCYLYPNGDLLAVYHADNDTPMGYGLAKMDKDSRLLWKYDARVHHDVDVGDDGAIYCLTEKLVEETPLGLSFIPSPWVTDSLVILSPDGRELDSIPLPEAFRDSPYAPLLGASSNDQVPFGVAVTRDSLKTVALDHDFLHVNSVRVLSRTLAPKFPLFKPGQVLLSLRNLSAVAVLDPQTRSVAWAARGIWRSQHDAEFLNNGRLLLFDNLGSPWGSRVLEYDPALQGVPWAYENENSRRFTALHRGMTQRLPNGNTLLVDPEEGRLLEVTPGKELVWECVCPSPSLGPGPNSLTTYAVTSMRRYAPDTLTFLKKEQRPRP